MEMEPGFYMVVYSCTVEKNRLHIKDNIYIGWQTYFWQSSCSQLGPFSIILTSLCWVRPNRPSLYPCKQPPSPSQRANCLHILSALGGAWSSANWYLAAMFVSHPFIQSFIPPLFHSLPVHTDYCPQTLDSLRPFSLKPRPFIIKDYVV